ncbi:MAG: TylF/MycF family methyltransferase [Rhodobacteraceae bacterium]|nr:TylF/MycF family methyltransferase [Paracoccaceae bacterium]
MDSHLENARELYIDLLRDILINDIYRDPPQQGSIVRHLSRKIRGKNEALNYDGTRREKGLDWPSVAHSMIGKTRMNNLRDICVDVIRSEIPGDLIETGVWRGGACIFVRGILKAYGDTGRTVWVADSFEGLPPPDGKKYAADKGDKHYKMGFLAISMEEVQENFRRYGLLDDQVRFLKGWFRDTLPTAPIDRLAVLRLDGDMYESTMDGLVSLYHKVSPGGYVIVDDYHAIAACKAAVHDFLDKEAPHEVVQIREIDGTGVFWKRTV